MTTWHLYDIWNFALKININQWIIVPTCPTLLLIVGLYICQWNPLGAMLDSGLVWVTLCYHEIPGKQYDWHGKWMIRICSLYFISSLVYFQQFLYIAYASLGTLVFSIVSNCPYLFILIKFVFDTILLVIYYYANHDSMSHVCFSPFSTWLWIHN